MKKILNIIGLLFLCNLISGQTVPVKNALKVAKNFFYESAYLQDNSKKFNDINLNLYYTETADKDSIYYAFNSINNNGWIVVAAQQNITPVLAYSLNGSFDTTKATQPPAFIYWMNNYKEQIKCAVKDKAPINKEVKSQWEEYDTVKSIIKSGKGVSQLLTTTWNQNCYYNALCPYDADASAYYCDRVAAGCVAVAMAQVMKYWNYPYQGQNSHSYSDPIYGTQSANFGNTVYDWTNMPDYLTSSNTAVARLIYHCGVAVNTTYNIAENGGSGAYLSDAASVMKTYFNYTNSGFHYKDDFSAAEWNNKLTNELNNKRPVLYRGGTHAFVCDGFEGINYFRFNWGWGGSCDGYFYLNSLTPCSSHNYTSDQGAIFDLYPDVPCGQTQSSPNTTGVIEDRCIIYFKPGFTSKSLRARVVP